MSRTTQSYYGPALQDRRENDVTFTYTAVGGQTDFAGLYRPGYVSVFKNGLKLVDFQDFTATDGVSVKTKTGCVAGDKVEIIGRSAFPLNDVYSKEQADLKLSSYFGIAGGSANSLVVITNPSFNKLLDGMEIRIRMSSTNTTQTPTININNIGSRRIRASDGSDVNVNAWANGEEVTLRYNLPLNSFILTTAKPIMANSIDVVQASSISKSMSPLRTREMIESTPISGIWGDEEASGFDIKHIQKAIGLVNDYSAGYVLLARNPFNNANRTGFTGTITAYRGSDSAHPYARQVFVNVMSSYNVTGTPKPQLYCFPVGSNDSVEAIGYQLVNCRYNGIDFIALRDTQASMGRLLFAEGVKSDAYGDGLPLVVPDTSVSNISVIKDVEILASQKWTTDNINLSVNNAINNNSANIASIVSSMFTGSNQSRSSIGYQKLPGGLIIQWGSYNGYGNDSRSITLPVTYSSIHLFASHTHAFGTNGYIPRAQPTGLSTLSLFSDVPVNVNGYGTHYWLSMGY